MSTNDNVPQSHPTLSARRALLVPSVQYEAEHRAAWEYLGKLLRSERLLRGFHRADVAAALGLHPAHHDYVVREIEAGTERLTVTQAGMLEEGLGIPAIGFMVQAGLLPGSALTDRMPLSGRPAPAAPPRPRLLVSGWQYAVCVGLVGGVALMTAAAVLVAWGSGAHSIAAAAVCVAAGWIFLSVPLAHFTGQWMQSGRRSR